MGLRYTNLDVSLSKTFKLTEVLGLQFRTDFFNILNHPNFTNPLLPNYTADMAQNGLTANGRDLLLALSRQLSRSGADMSRGCRLPTAASC